MKIISLVQIGLIFFSVLTVKPPAFAQETDGTANLPYVKTQKEFYEKVMSYLKDPKLKNIDRNDDFDICPFDKMRDDFLGHHFHSLHVEQAGFLDCDGPTYLSVYDNGLFINHTGFTEYKCYLNQFELEYCGLRSGISKYELLQLYGMPLAETENLFIYGCTFDVDPFDEEPVEPDDSDPNAYLLDFFFVFENNKLSALVKINEHMCY